MAAQLELVTKMTQSPATCLLCHNSPVDETREDRRPLPAIFAPGLDVNWGESVYICAGCVGLMADLMDRPAQAEVEKIESRKDFLEKRMKKVSAELDTTKARLDKIIAGKKAVKEAREAKRNG
jgi:hypothetical protein